MGARRRHGRTSGGPFGASLVILSLLALVAIVATPAINDWLDRRAVHDVTDSWFSGDPSDTVPEAPPEFVEEWVEGWTVAPGGTEPVGAGPLYRYRVEVETATGLDAASVASVVDYVLGHPQGWTNDGVAFQRVDDGGPVDMVVRLATPGTVDALCAPLETNGQVSCRTGIDVILNQLRWETGVDAYAGDIDSYRIVLINHEVGHLLGHAEHVPCPGPGRPAPVMMQIYYTGLQGCAPNVWPYAADGTFIG